MNNPDNQYEVLEYRRWDKGWLHDLSKIPDYSQSGTAIANYLEKLGIKTVIKQTDYTDLDYSAAFARFYSYCFQPPPKTCTRYIFFTKDFGSVHDVHKAEIANSFLGFITVWPTYPNVIGGSVLPFPSGVAHKVATPYRIHVSGKELTPRKPSAMFACKDHAVSVCASIATWLATDLLHRKYDLATCSSAEITLLATGGDPKWGRPLPQVYGLDNEQIVRALWALGYGPVVYYYDQSGPAPRDASGNPSYNWIGHLYAYLCSGFPVIIICEVEGNRHAVLAVGLKTSTTSQSHLGRSFTRLVEDVIVHDDRWGPYSILKTNPKDKRSRKCTLRDFLGNDPKKTEICALIVPLPQSVVLTSSYAHDMGREYLRTAIRKYAPEYPDYAGPFRTFLQRSIDFKNALGWQKENLRIAQTFLELPIPRWVWVTEAYEPLTRKPNKNKIFARAIFDSTQTRFDKKRLFLAAHVAKNFFRRIDDATGR